MSSSLLTKLMELQLAEKSVTVFLSGDSSCEGSVESTGGEKDCERPGERGGAIFGDLIGEPGSEEACLIGETGSEEACWGEPRHCGEAPSTSCGGRDR